MVLSSVTSKGQCISQTLGTKCRTAPQCDRTRLNTRAHGHRRAGGAHLLPLCTTWWQRELVPCTPPASARQNVHHKAAASGASGAQTNARCQGLWTRGPCRLSEGRRNLRVSQVPAAAHRHAGRQSAPLRVRRSCSKRGPCAAISVGKSVGTLQLEYVMI